MDGLLKYVLSIIILLILINMASSLLDNKEQILTPNEQLKSEIKEELKTELYKELKDELKSELRKELEDELYKELYEELNKKSSPFRNVPFRGIIDEKQEKATSTISA